MEDDEFLRLVQEIVGASRTQSLPSIRRPDGEISFSLIRTRIRNVVMRSRATRLRYHRWRCCAFRIPRIKILRTGASAQAMGCERADLRRPCQRLTGRSQAGERSPGVLTAFDDPLLPTTAPVAGS